MFTDTERLNFLLRFFLVEDVGDEFPIPGVVILCEILEDWLSLGAWNEETKTAPAIAAFGDDLRDVIDRAIAEHGQRR